jgi:hypothetical protein
MSANADSMASAAAAMAGFASPEASAVHGGSEVTGG